MKLYTKAAAALLATTAIAHAGGVERQNQSVAILFEEGTYVELSFSFSTTEVSGTSSATTASSDDVSTDFWNGALRFRQDINDQLSFALIGENHIGADVRYDAGTGYPIGGSFAELPAASLTALVRYELPSSFSIYGGARVSRAEGNVSLPFASGYTLNTGTDTAYGYVLGVAYERPDIALRVALTYNSEYTHEFDATEGGPVPGVTNLEVTIPQSLMLEAQSGIAEDTLLFGSVRWVDWTAFDITPTNYTTFVVPGGSLVSYDDDSITYTLGLGRRFTDEFAGAVSVLFEPENNTQGSNLGPTDGRIALGVGGTYNLPNGVEISGGVQYSWLGNTTTVPAVGTGDFRDNNSIAVGLTVGMGF
ncbi:MAG: outer membrane protein transport protein [Pseudomonadota bacterium]